MTAPTWLQPATTTGSAASATRFPLLWIPPLALLTLAPLLATEVDPWARMVVALAAAATSVALALPGVPPPTRLGMQFALLAVPALLLATWLGADAAGARSRLVDFALCLIAFRAGRDLLGRAGRKWVPAGLALVGGLTAARGLYQRWVTFPDALETLAGSAEASVVALRMATGRVFSTFLLPSAFAGFLLLSLPLSLSFALRPGVRPLWRWLALISAGLQAVALFLTYSMGAFLSLAVALGVLGVLVAGAGVRRAALLAAGATLVLLLAVVLLRGESFSGPSSEVAPLAERLGNWQVAAAQIVDHPVAGVGWGAYGASYTRYQQPGMNQSRYVHNSYLQVVAEGGLLTLPLLLAFAAWLMRRLRALAPQERLLGVAVMAVLLHNTVDFTLLLPGIAVPFFFVLAGLAPGESPAAADRAGWAGAGRAAALLLALAVAGLTITETLARRDFVLAQEQARQGSVPAAGAAIRSAIRWDPWNAGYRDFLARWLLQQGGTDAAMLEQAESAARRAIQLAPRRPLHHATLERVCLARGDRGCAYREAVRAAALFPLSTEYQQRPKRYLAPGEAP